MTPTSPAHPTLRDPMRPKLHQSLRLRAVARTTTALTRTPMHWTQAQALRIKDFVDDNDDDDHDQDVYFHDIDEEDNADSDDDHDDCDVDDDDAHDDGNADADGDEVASDDEDLIFCAPLGARLGEHLLEVAARLPCEDVAKRSS